jgi:peptidoglycan-associated lipoprotein
MKNNLTTKVTISLFLGSLLLLGAGCGKKTVVPPTPKDSSGNEMSGGNNINYPTAEGGYSEDNLPAEGSLDDTAMPGGSAGSLDQQTDEYKKLHGRSSANLYPIYFDFDQAGIRGDMAQIMISNAEYLKSIPGTTVIIEGNSDERGTSEYNLALGERRAITAQQYLVNLGIDTYRMRTLSYGEEQPVFTEQNEEAYSQNRRVDFIVK